MIKNIVFDIGNVLTDFRLMEFLHDKGLDGEMAKRVIMATVKTPYWDEFDKGAISEEEAMYAFAKGAPDIAEEIHKAFDDISNMVVPRDYAIPFLKELKAAGYHVYYLSNFSKKAYDECRESLSFLEEMEGGMMSFQEYIVKPNPVMYYRFLKRFSLVPEECVFLDDTPGNVTAAIESGMQGLVFTTKEQAVEDLRALGVRI